MAYLTLSDSLDISPSIKEKIDFYLQCNKFGVMQELNLKNLSYTTNQIVINIKKNLSKIKEQVNFIYINDTSDWSVLCVSDPKNPLIMLNLAQIKKEYSFDESFDGVKEAVAYATIFGFLGIYFGNNFCFSCFGNLVKQGEYTAQTFKKYREIANYLFAKYKDEFMFFLTSNDEKINKIFAFGRKYVFSISILYSEERLNLSTAAKLLDLSEEDAYIFLDEYKGVAYIAYLNHKTGKGQK